MVGILNKEEDEEPGVCKIATRLTFRETGSLHNVLPER